MADEFISVPIEYDENQLYERAILRVQDRYPNWRPAPGSLADMTLRVCSSMASIGAENASNVIPDIFRYFGKLAKVPPFAAKPAIATVRFTVKDAAGYEIPALTPVGLKTADMPNPVGFGTSELLTIPNGSTTGDITVIAFELGAANNNLNQVVRVDALDSFVTDVTLLVEPMGGFDEELTQDYLNRLSKELELWTITPITEDNFAALASKIPGIYRAAAWENYNPADGTTDNEKYVTVCPIDVDGSAVSGAIKTALAAYYESLREVNFVAPIDDPTYNSIDISYTAHIWQTFNSAGKQADIEAALRALINKASWGMTNAIPFRIPVWKNTPTIRLNLVVQAIENALTGTGWSENVEIGIHGSALAAADLLMTGAFPLPDVGTITPTIVVES